MRRYIALIPAAGVGARFGATYPKQYHTLAGKTVLQHTVDRFLALGDIDQVLLVVSGEDSYIDHLYPPASHNAKLQLLRCGGATRAKTVLNALKEARARHLLDSDDWVLVHDAARCCISHAAILRLIRQVGDDAVGGLLALPVADTLKEANGQQQAIRTIKRQNVWQAQTPQMFRTGLLQEALVKADVDQITDDASAIEAMGLTPMLVEGEASNFKLTRPEDASLATFFLQQELES
ncbi:2-C-methyl-D-erythritol 4-phosphate cytidylyltransferase [Neisseriaceae bacterium ESL0693]|nr:2-C-methyl-D-erythritol 4-phosphate cytidylyltransferase [Neisseriaceae bacterium ESL0693]